MTWWTCNSLSLPEQVEAMVNYIVDEPPEDANDKLKLVYPYKVSFYPNAAMRYLRRRD